MKLERMNEQQIRCTITSEDLKARQIKISELAYGTDKARTLFRDMMIAAENELDFEAGDEPLMIEATPINSECIILTVTKVDDPEELDTRFARFAPDLIEDKYDEDDPSSRSVYLIEITDSALVMMATVYYAHGIRTELVKDEVNTKVFETLTENGIEMTYDCMNVIMRDDL